MPDRVDVARPHALAHLELRLDLHILTAQRSTSRELLGDIRWGNARRESGRRGICPAAVQFCLRQEFRRYQAIDEQLDESLVVLHLQVLGWRQDFMFVAEVPTTGRAKWSGGADETPRACFPLGMERSLVFAHLDGTHILHAAHIVYAVHVAAPPRPATFATPTIALRVTRAANASSVIFSVPGGRSGRTR